MTHTRTTSRTLAFVVAAALALPTLALTGCGSKNNDTSAGGGGGYTNAPTPMAQPQKQGMTGKQKVVLLAGAALLYYMYKRYQKQNAAAAGPNGRPQLYQSKNGGIYYRDPRTHQPTWVTAPQQSMQVDQTQLQQYAPDYQQYQGQPAPPAPAGYRTQSFSQLDPSMAGGPSGPRGPGM